MSDLFTPEYFEKHITTVVPIVNVDLLIKDKEGRILLSWRDDGMFYGWHFPGRIVRFKESLEDAILLCLMGELGYNPLGNFTFCNLPVYKYIDYFQTIKKQDHRGHFITFLYEVEVEDKTEYFDSHEFNTPLRLENVEKDSFPDGYLKWFDKYPDDLIPEHDIYRKYFK